MKYSPTLPNTLVNRPKSRPVVELFWMVGGLLLIVGAVFWLMGVVTDLSVKKMPLDFERFIGAKIVNSYPGTRLVSLEPLLARMMKHLPETSIVHQYAIEIYSYESSEINAMAMPGGRIMVSEGLLRTVESENELVMVLGHELGHFDQRDHLKGLGRGLGAVVLAAALTGPGSRMSDFIMKTLLSFQLNYSRTQERSADEFGVELLIKQYGHGGGSTTFFRRLRANASVPPEFFSTHPDPQNRIAHIIEIVKQRGVPVGETAPYQMVPELVP